MMSKYEDNGLDEGIEGEHITREQVEGTHSEFDENGDPVKEKVSKRRRILRAASNISPHHGIKAGAKLGYGSEHFDFKGYHARTKGVFKRAWFALRKPPIWTSIEALEEDWGIDDYTREQTKRGLRFERNAWAVALVLCPLIFWMGLSTLPNPSYRPLYLVAIGVSLSTCIIRATVAHWRFVVLETRIPMNLMQYLGGAANDGR